MLNSIFMLSKYLKKSVTTALILGLMLAPGLSAAQGVSSSVSVAAQAAEEETQAEETQATATQATTGDWSADADTSWYDDNKTEPSYTLTRADQLAGLAYLVNVEGVTFEGKTIKIADSVKEIDLGAHYWVPIGLDSNKPFKGSFDGSNKTISNMRIGTDENRANYEYAGLFGYVRADSDQTVTIENVNIGNGSWIHTEGNYAGGICAHADTTAGTGAITISNCYNSGTISAFYGAGGICAGANVVAGAGTIKISNCINSGTISSYKTYASVGGICADAHARADLKADGYAYAEDRNSTAGKITISNCSNIGTISAFDSAGGICANANAKAIAYVAGTAEAGTITINNCSNSGDISASHHAGGICAYANACAAANAYCDYDADTYGSNATVGTAEAGTIKISNCCNSGTISTKTKTETHSYTYAGGICADVYAAAAAEEESASSYFYNKHMVAAGTAKGGTIIISNCYNSSDIFFPSTNATDSAGNARDSAGGICADAGAKAFTTTDDSNATAGTIAISNCYYKQGKAYKGIGWKAGNVGEIITALPESQMKAASGVTNQDGWVDITIDGNNQGKIALVDALNAWVENENENYENEYKYWELETAEGPGKDYPVLQSAVAAGTVDESEDYMEAFSRLFEDSEEVDYSDESEDYMEAFSKLFEDIEE